MAEGKSDHVVGRGGAFARDGAWDVEFFDPRNLHGFMGFDEFFLFEAGAPL